MSDLDIFERYLTDDEFHKQKDTERIHKDKEDNVKAEMLDYIINLVRKETQTNDIIEAWSIYKDEVLFNAHK